MIEYDKKNSIRVHNDTFITILVIVQQSRNDLTKDFSNVVHTKMRAILKTEKVNVRPGVWIGRLDHSTAPIRKTLEIKSSRHFHRGWLA